MESLFFQGNPCPMWVYDRESLRLLAVNAAAVACYGYTPEEFLSFTVPDLHPPEEAERVRAFISEHPGTLRTANGWRHRVSNGSLIDVEVSSNDIEYDGRPARLVVVLDRTGYAAAAREREKLIGQLERLVAENSEIVQRISESERRFRSTFDQAAVGMAHASLDGRFVAVNARFVAQTGYSAEEMLSLSFKDITHPDDLGLQVQQIQRLLSGEISTFSMEKRYVRKDGTDLWARLTVSLVRDDAGHPEYFIGVTEDIGGRRRVEEARRESEERFRTLVETMAQGILIFSRDGEIIGGNPAAEEILGVALDELIGRTSMDPRWRAIHEDATNFLGEDHPAQVALRTGEEVDGVVMGVFNPRDGRHRWILIHARPQFRPGEDTPHQVFTTFGDISELRSTENALRESEERFRALIENVHEVITILEPDARFRYISPAVERILGWTPGELDGKAYLDLVHPDDLPRVMWFFATLAADPGMSEPTLVRMRHKNGTWRYLEGTGKNLLTHPLIRGLVSNSRDVTERHEAEAALRESEERFRQLAENVNEIFWLVDTREKRTLYVSPAIRKIWGLEPETLNASEAAWLEHVHEDDRDAAAAAMLLAYSGEEEPDQEFRILRPDGDVRWVRSRMFPIRDESGQVYRVAGLLEDATNRREAEEAIRQANEKLRAIVNTSPLAIVVVDGDRNVVLWNRAAEELFGWRADEVIGRPYPLEAPAGEQTAHAVFQEAYEGATAHGREVRRLARDGRVLDLALWNAQLVDANDAPRGLIGVFADIGDRKTLEEQLRQSQKMEAVGRLAGGVAHDFNNILTALGGQAELLLDALTAADPMREELIEMKRGVDRAAALTRHLLAFSRKQVLQPKVLDLNAIVSDTRHMLRRLIGEDVELETTLASDLATLRADPGQLEQVILNLVVNARDAMPQGGKLTIATANARLDAEAVPTGSGVQPGDYVLLSVSDTGRGIPETIIPFIFEPFFTTKEKGKGTGLGLSTVYGIVQQSGGHIDVESGVGRGTTFRVYLPRVEERAPVVEPRRPVATVEGRGETILLVEDENAVRSLARKILDRRGYNVLEAEDGPTALRIAGEFEGPIHLLLTDVIMPQMSGREVASTLLQSRPDTRVLYVSGYTEDIISHHGVLDAGIAFLEKPFPPAELARRVREVLDAVRPEPAAVCAS